MLEKINSSSFCQFLGGYSSLCISKGSRLLPLQVYHQEYLVNIILLNTKLAPGNLVGGMVKDLHQHGRLHALLPCMVAKGLAQAVAA